MYVPAYARNHNTAEIHQFIRNNGFGILITHHKGKTLATHIPMVLEDDGKKLSGHVARANPHWKSFRNTGEALAVFNGPHAYVSSSWYDHENVPTWNYIAAHVYGTLRILEGEELAESLGRLVDKYEKHSEKPVSIAIMTPSYFQREIRGVVGFEMKISGIEAAYKLSQNRDQKNNNRIVEKLDERNQPGDSEVALEMRKKSFDI